MIQVVQALEADPSLRTTKDRIEEFIKRTGSCRATYFNLKKGRKLNEQLPRSRKTEVPKRTLVAKPPVELDLEEEVAKAEEENRQQEAEVDQGGENESSPTGTDDSKGEVPARDHADRDADRAA